MSNGAARRPKNSPAGCSGSDHTEASNIARHEARLEHPVIWIASNEMFRRHSGSNTPMGCSGSDQEADIRESGAGLGSQVRGAAGTAPFCFRRTGAGAISPDRSLRTSAEFLSTQSRDVPFCCVSGDVRCIKVLDTFRFSSYETKGNRCIIW